MCCRLSAEEGRSARNAGKKGQPRAPHCFLFSFFFPSALYVHNAALGVQVGVSLILLLVQLNLSYCAEFRIGRA